VIYLNVLIFLSVL